MRLTRAAATYSKIALSGNSGRVLAAAGYRPTGAATGAWHRQQLPLADRFALEIADRAGYGRSQQVSPGEGLDADAALVAALLAEGAHLVGHSSGAVAAMLAASLRPGAVLSLTLCEPVAFQVAPGSAEAQQNGPRPGGAPAATRRRCTMAARFSRDRRPQRRGSRPAARPRWRRECRRFAQSAAIRGKVNSRSTSSRQRRSPN